MILVITKHLKNYLGDLYYKQTTIDDIERKQDEITGVIGALKGYASRNNKYVEAKNKFLNNVEKFYKGREKNIEGFKDGVFPLYYDERHEHQMKAQREIEKEEIGEKRRRQREKKEKQKESEENEFFKCTENESEDLSHT